MLGLFWVTIQFSGFPSSSHLFSSLLSGQQNTREISHCVFAVDTEVLGLQVAIHTLKISYSKMSLILSGHWVIHLLYWVLASFPTEWLIHSCTKTSITENGESKILPLDPRLLHFDSPLSWPEALLGHSRPLLEEHSLGWNSQLLSVHQSAG